VLNAERIKVKGGKAASWLKNAPSTAFAREKKIGSRGFAIVKEIGLVNVRRKGTLWPYQGKRKYSSRARD